MAARNKRNSLAGAGAGHHPFDQGRVDFSDPHRTGVDEIIIFGSTSAPIKRIDHLSGKQIHVRKSSSYYESRLALNARFKEFGKRPIKIEPAAEYLEDEDLLERISVKKKKA